MQSVSSKGRFRRCESIESLHAQSLKLTPEGVKRVLLGHCFSREVIETSEQNTCDQALFRKKAVENRKICAEHTPTRSPRPGPLGLSHRSEKPSTRTEFHFEKKVRHLLGAARCESLPVADQHLRSSRGDFLCEFGMPVDYCHDPIDRRHDNIKQLYYIAFPPCTVTNIAIRVTSG